MALREGGCYLVRRFADRGIDKNIGDTRICGDRFNRDRRSAGRGNEIGNRDPRDIVKIKRLRQRVQDLEEIKRLKRRVRDLELQLEIKRLRQRIRHLKLQQDTCQTETESSTVVRDEGGDGEQQPFSRHLHQFYEPTYPDDVWKDGPKFDEDGIKPDEDECVFVQLVLNRTTIQEDEQIEANGEDEDGKSVEDDIALVTYGDLVAMESRTMGMLKDFLLNKELDNYPQFQIKVNCKVSKLADILADNKENSSIIPNMGVIQKDYNITVGPNVKEDCMDLIFGCLASLHEKSLRGLSNIKYDGVGLTGSVETLKYGLTTNKHGMIDYCGPCTVSMLEKHTKTGGSVFESVVNEMRSHVPFDPGGTRLKLGETIRKVGLFRWVVIIVHKNRIDVPFDPGGFAPKAKLEDEFFSKTGSMMQGYLQVY